MPRWQSPGDDVRLRNTISAADSTISKRNHAVELKRGGSRGAPRLLRMAPDRKLLIFESERDRSRSFGIDTRTTAGGQCLQEPTLPSPPARSVRPPVALIGAGLSV